MKPFFGRGRLYLVKPEGAVPLRWDERERPLLPGVPMDQLLTTESRQTLKDMLDAYERQIIEEALLASHGNQRRAARALGVLPTTLHEKMKRLGLLRRAEPEAPERDLGGHLVMVG